MPYIKQERRDQVKPELDCLKGRIKNYEDMCMHVEVIAHDYAYQTNQNDKLFKITDFIVCDGDLNYILTSLIWSFLDENPGYTNHRRVYSFLEKLKLNFIVNFRNDTDHFLHGSCHGYEETPALEVIGVISNIIQETYRRKTAPYEDLKIKENGDV